jgi:hypothetical protein
MKSFIHIFFLSLWLFAVCAPNLGAWLDTDKPVVANTLGEEEPPDPLKTFPDDAMFLNARQAKFSLLPPSKKMVLADFEQPALRNSPLEILLPPPKLAL